MPHKPSPGPVSAEDRAHRHARLLDAALDEFITFGYAAANLDRIAETAGISKMTIYRQVGEKEQLFQLTTEAAIAAISVELAELMGRLPPLAEMVRAFVDLVRKRINSREHGLLRLAIAERRSFPDLSDRLLERVEALYQPMIDYLHEVAGGRLSLEQVRRQTLMLQAMATGGSLALLGLSEAEADPWADDACALFLRGFDSDRL